MTTINVWERIGEKHLAQFVGEGACAGIHVLIKALRNTITTKIFLNLAPRVLNSNYLFAYYRILTKDNER